MFKLIIILIRVYFLSLTHNSIFEDILNFEPLTYFIEYSSQFYATQNEISSSLKVMNIHLSIKDMKAEAFNMSLVILLQINGFISNTIYK